MASTEKGSARIWIVVGILAVLALAGAGATAWLMMNRAEAGEPAKPEAPQRAAQPVFLKLDSFTVNLQSGTCGDRLLYVGITLELGNDETLEFIKAHLPQVRSRMLMVLSGQHAADLISGQGKEKLAGAIHDLFDKPFVQPQPKLLVDDVLFTQFIVQ